VATEIDDYPSAHPAESDSKGQCCLIVGKNGNTTDLTGAHCTNLVSFTQNEVGIDSVKLHICNLGNKPAVRLPSVTASLSLSPTLIGLECIHLEQRQKVHSDNSMNK
jgi:hypothetical protein